ncbi:MAG: hypothetical protein K8R34_06790, partial [Methanosarcinales archaeon]|nr:hypothetical protein [Methanosarcinales archaeon]
YKGCRSQAENLQKIVSKLKQCLVDDYHHVKLTYRPCFPIKDFHTSPIRSIKPARLGASYAKM